MFSEAQSCQSCVFRSAIFLPCSVHAVTRQMKCTHCRLSFECCYRRHNNRHQSELPERGPASSRPDPCCLLLIPAQTCPHRRHQNSLTNKALMWQVRILVRIESTVMLKNLRNSVCHFSQLPTHHSSSRTKVVSNIYALPIY
jgi:hypothetical protein